jgi:Predicted signaling protein consisting of a modified GGDEF domain and a DHH domain
MNVFLNELTTKIRKNKNIIIMTHRYMDLDGFGAALGLAKVLEKYNRNPKIIINKDEADGTILKALKKLSTKVKFDFIKKEKLNDLPLEGYLLIVLDVHKKEMVEEPELISKVKETIIIDHHVKGSGKITKTEISLITTSVSSTVEIMVNYLKKEKMNVEPVIATIMLAGMYIDTNNFNVKTTSDTFKAASYLMENGANNILKQELFQENKKIFLRRQKLLKNSFMFKKNLIICTLDQNIYKPSDLAKIAEELLQFEEVEASFVIGKLENSIVGVSSRSLGKINVGKVMEKLGGGGHKTDAATKLEKTTITKVKEQITNILK